MVIVLLADGFEEAEVIVPVDLLRRGGVDVVLAGVDGLSVQSSHNITVRADVALGDVNPNRDDMVFVPGGMGGVDGILKSGAACELLRRAAETDCRLAAICAGPTVLSRLGLIDGRNAVCYPGMEDLLSPAVAHPGEHVVRDGRLLTAQAAGSAFDLGLAMLEDLKGKEIAQQVAQSVCFHG